MPSVSAAGALRKLALRGAQAETSSLLTTSRQIKHVCLLMFLCTRINHLANPVVTSAEALYLSVRFEVMWSSSGGRSSRSPRSHGCTGLCSVVPRGVHAAIDVLSDSVHNYSLMSSSEAAHWTCIRHVETRATREREAARVLRQLEDIHSELDSLLEESEAESETQDRESVVVHATRCSFCLEEHRIALVRTLPPLHVP